ncbi:hypothetical protein PCASD_07516 [Puccinia coronata f. sp. avenae]|uniref:Uncharacterized protein n=1 Tax=Puccinia coronata f. sp. avenae TaxID=200324 RepID=A0A2N5V0C3_9BASI|nr:hypothetical protein PCASD_07516 [Puccinia coronata f. sp. avenae]
MPSDELHDLDEEDLLLIGVSVLLNTMNCPVAVPRPYNDLPLSGADYTMGRVSQKPARPLDALCARWTMGTRPSIGRFTLKAPVGRSMEASSGRFEIKAPVGRLMAASSGRYLTGAPVGRHHKASSGRSCQVAPIGRCHQASNGRFNLKAPTGRFHGASNGRFQGEAANGHAADPQCMSVQLPTTNGLVALRLSLSIDSRPPIGCFRDASWRLRLDGTHIRPGRGQPPDGSHATKIWMTNGCPKMRPLVVRREPWCTPMQYSKAILGAQLISSESQLQPFYSYAMNF